MVLFVFGALFLFKKNLWGRNKKFKELMEKNFCLKNEKDLVALFPRSVEDVNFQKEEVIKAAKLNVAKIKNIKPQERTFDNTARALDDAGAICSMGAGPLSILLNVSPDKKILDASVAAINELEAFAVDFFEDKELYEIFKSYVENNSKNEELSAEQKYFLEEKMADFKKSGFDLPEDQFLAVKKLKKEILSLSMEFAVNIASDKSTISVAKEALDGISEDFIKSLKKDDKGLYILGCDYPTMHEIFENCKVEDTRKKFYFIFKNRAYPKNDEILEKILKLREGLAKRLGFKDYASLDIDRNMAQNPLAVNNFLFDLRKKGLAKVEVEKNDFISNLPLGVKLTEDNKIQPWDFDYIKSEYKKKFFNVDEGEIAKYFPMEKTLEAVFDLYQNFLGLKFKILSGEKLWHKDVKIVEVFQKDSGEFRGYILLDLHPRENKYSHACHAGIIPTIKYKNQKGEEIVRPSLAVVIANFPKSTKDQPSLLKHDDVNTFYHELGHAMHFLLGRTELAYFSGTATKHDFVEVPSQMFEKWMWNKDVLKKISSNYITGEPLPDVLIDQKLKLKNYDIGFLVVNRLVLPSLVSLQIYQDRSGATVDKIVSDIYTKLCVGVRFEPKVHMQASFGHLTEYASKYYCYLWSKVFSIDLFDAIEKAGIFDPIVGKKLVDEVLSKGGSVDPNILLENFLGRKPSQEAFMKRLV